MWCHSLTPRCFGGCFFCLFPLAGVDFTLFWFVVFFCLFLLCSFVPFVWIDVFQYLEPFSLLGGLLFFSSRLALQHGKHVLRYVSSRRTLLSLDVFQERKNENSQGLRPNACQIPDMSALCILLSAYCSNLSALCSFQKSK